MAGKQLENGSGTRANRPIELIAFVLLAGIAVATIYTGIQVGYYTAAFRWWMYQLHIR